MLVAHNSKPSLSININNDLRSISLTPTISKVLKSFAAEWILVTISDKFDEKQFGGLRGRSTVHALCRWSTYILYTWHQALDKTQSVRVMFMDFAKASDHVDHAIVLKKLAELGVIEFICSWFHSFLSVWQQKGWKSKRKPNVALVLNNLWPDFFLSSWICKLG